MVTPTRSRRSDLLQPAVYLISDLLALELAFLGTYVVRFRSGWFLTPLGVPPFMPYLYTSLVLLLVWAGIFHAQGLYDPTRRKSIEEDVFGLIKGVIAGSLCVLALAFFLRSFSYSRSFFGLFFLASLLLLVLTRVAARGVLARVLRRGIGGTRVLFVGRTAMREQLLDTFRRLPGLGMFPVGEVALPGGAADRPAPQLTVLGQLADLPVIVTEHRVDLVLLTLPFEELALVTRLADDLSPLHVDVQFVPDMHRIHTSRMRLKEIAGIPFISVREVGLSGMDRIVKRTFDLVFSALGLLLTSPLLVLIALLVKATSPGPVLYRQERLGRDNRPFQMLKFRTMRVDAESGTGPVWAQQRDPRRTAIGPFLRRLSLDELPQLWNVLTGEMSLVGPRPERAHFAEQFRATVPRYLERHRVRSGLTGWAQVNGLRGNTPIEVRTLYDLHYIENWSLGLDLRILLRTLKSVFKGENAY
jgi:exopolysaccharide biosynthesis polyprenyl glycosylphosphotransferase